MAPFDFIGPALSLTTAIIFASLCVENWGEMNPQASQSTH